jgi:hypothetical protein
MQNNQKMARPKKDPSEQLKVFSTMRFISNVNYLPATGYALEKYFEPENFKTSKSTGRLIRSSKWDRYLKKGVRPEGKSLESIKSKCPSAYKHYCSPFWEAIKTKEKSESEWEDFYLTLNRQVMLFVFEFLNDPKLTDGRVKEENQPLIKLIRIGDDHAVAALIGLTRQFRQNRIHHDYIETQLFNLMFNFMSYFFSYDAVLIIYKYLFEQFFNCLEYRLRELRWPNDAEEMISIENKNLLLAENLGMVATYEQQREFFFWKSMGDNFEIIQEMTNAFYESKWILTNHPKGLKWLIQCLNKTRPKNKKLNTEYI